MSVNTNKNMTLDVFKYHSAMHYIREIIDFRGHGFKSAMARAMACQSAYVSRVLKDQASFSLEQAERLSRLFNHSPIESKYFLTLVLRDRSGTPELRGFFEAELKQLQYLRPEKSFQPLDASRV